MAKRALIAHPDCSSPKISVGCKVSQFGRDALKLEYVMTGAVDRILISKSSIPTRTDGLWDATCFELFLAHLDGSYVEFNFAPSQDWASYRFESYRSDMAPALDLRQPDIFVEQSEQRFALTAYAELPPNELDSMVSLALCAVIEEVDGTKSYWALKHPPGPPDFHHPDCFVLHLGAPDKA